jgi:hypothetical protein
MASSLALIGGFPILRSFARNGAKQTSSSFQNHHQIFRVWPRSLGSISADRSPFLVCKGAYMAGSWRDILESATADLPVDRGRVRPDPVLHRPVSRSPEQRPPANSYSAAQARSLLERELAAFTEMPADVRLASAPARPAEHWPTITRRGPAARQGRDPCTQEAVPYNSLMAALSTATPAMLRDVEKSAPAKRTPPARSPKRLLRRSLFAISLLAMGAAAYTLLSRGGKDLGTSQTGRAPSVTNSNNVWVDVPLPSRRPSALRGQQSSGRSGPGGAAN